MFLDNSHQFILWTKNYLRKHKYFNQITYVFKINLKPANTILIFHDIKSSFRNWKQTDGSVFEREIVDDYISFLPATNKFLDDLELQWKIIASHFVLSFTLLFSLLSEEILCSQHISRLSSQEGIYLF